jgi:hypothetical protein
MGERNGHSICMQGEWLLLLWFRDDSGEITMFGKAWRNDDGRFVYGKEYWY